jgi:origin recognition complex subunit 2
VDSLLDDLAERFEQWELELEEGFNLLMYGYGSKRRLLNRFVVERPSRKGHCVIVNGHYPGLGIKDILSQIEDTLAIPQDLPVPPSASTPLERSAHRLYAYLLPPEAIPPAKRKTMPTSESPLYLVIHNVDAISLRTPRSLSILSLLASSPRIHLVASFDHIHTPLLFPAHITDSGPHTYEAGSWTGIPPSSRGFNWLYHNATTYDDYDLELSYQRLSASTSLSGLSGGSTGGISEEGALQILRSVPPMALRLLKLLLTKQLASLPPNPASHTAYPANPVAPVFGIDNDILQKLAREKFIAREEERYNALIGDFRDHGLVVEALTDMEGRQGKWVWIPLGKAALERVVQEMGAVDV